MKKNGLVFLAVLLLGAIRPGILLAEEAFFDTGDFFPGKAWTIAGPRSGINQQMVADRVLLDADWRLDRLTIANFYVRGEAQYVTVLLMTEVAGLPGEVIDQWDVDTDTAPMEHSVETPSQPVLTADTPYWIALVPGSEDQWAAWNWSQSRRGPIAYSTNGGKTWIPFNDLLGSLRLEGTPMTQPVE